MTPYERGFDDGYRCAAVAPNYPRGNASWAEKLYFRGYKDGHFKRVDDGNVALRAADQQSGTQNKGE